MLNTVTRRGLLSSAAAAFGALALPRGAQAQQPAQAKRVLRFAHLTDMHVQPGPAADGLAQAFRHVQSLADPVELILTGGDTIMDSFAADQARTAEQWAVWQSVKKAECSLPMRSCLGNHGVWGGNKQASKTTGDEPLYGKKWACQEFGIERPYYSFDQAGWHFIVLDSTLVVDSGYWAKLDGEQMEWFRGDLAATPSTTPVLVLTHEPILAICPLLTGGKIDPAKPQQVVGPDLMNVDAPVIKDMFREHGNVRAVLSGHIHLIDQVTYNNTTYFCDGAVSGNWWNVTNPNRLECQPGYSTFDLYADGSVVRQEQVYGWKPAV